MSVATLAKVPPIFLIVSAATSAKVPAFILSVSVAILAKDLSIFYFFLICRPPLSHYGYLSRGSQCRFYLSKGGKNMSVFALLKDKSDYIM